MKNNVPVVDTGGILQNRGTPSISDSATCEVVIGSVGPRTDVTSFVSLTGAGVCNLPAGHVRDDRAVCLFHAEYGGDLPFTLAELRDTDPHWAIGGPRHMAGAKRRRLAS